MPTAWEGEFHRGSEMDGGLLSDLGRVQSAMQPVEVIGFGSVGNDFFAVRHGFKVVLGLKNGSGSAPLFLGGGRAGVMVAGPHLQCARNA